MTAPDRWADIVDLPITTDPADDEAYLAAVMAEHEHTATQTRTPDSDHAATPDLPNLPDDFWAARPELKHIQTAAHSRLCSADAVLHGVLARLSGMVDPNLRFDVGLGPGSLNLFVAAVGTSGIGKTTGAKLARELVHTPAHLNRTTEDGRPTFWDGLPLGSGEGMAEAFMGVVVQDTDDTDRKGKTKTIRVRQQVRHHAFFSVDEGEQLTRTAERSGATIGPTIRSAWVGEVLGQANASEDRMRVIAAGTYSLGMLVGYQPDTAAPLLADSGPGTPQRFLWCSAHDPSVPDQRIEHPGPLYIPLTTEGGWPITGVMPAADEIRDELWQRKIALARGETTVAPLDAHEPLLRSKVAALLALLDGRTDITVDDWALSQIVWDTSCAVRDGLLEIGATARKKERERATRDKVDQQLRIEAAVTGLESTVKRIADRLARRADEEGGLTNGAAWRAVAYRDRQQGGREVFEAALDYGSAHGMFVRGEHGITSIAEASR
jgi:hypothetical protein